ncbi:hypothetical protein VCHA53O466_50411 [Vibrio chagasii]|nr:hypothetical protein VCHA53O466_50411 [Vibrio chagasii]
MAIKSNLHVKESDNELFRQVSVSISFKLTRQDVFTIIGKAIILDTDPDLPEENGLEFAREQIQKCWTGKGVAEQSLRLALKNDGQSYKWEEEVMSQEDILMHRPLCAQMINGCINTYLPQFNVTENDREAYQNWKLKYDTKAQGAN